MAVRFMSAILVDAGEETLNLPTDADAVNVTSPYSGFNESTTEAGRDALGYYHERKDEQRYIGLGPEHDWSSHAADAFGLMAISYEPPEASRRFKLNYPPTGLVWPRIRLISAG